MTTSPKPNRITMLTARVMAEYAAARARRESYQYYGLVAVGLDDPLQVGQVMDRCSRTWIEEDGADLELDGVAVMELRGGQPREAEQSVTDVARYHRPDSSQAYGRLLLVASDNEGVHADPAWQDPGEILLRQPVVLAEINREEAD